MRRALTVFMAALLWSATALAQGGGGFSGGNPMAIRQPASQGFAAGSTDTGHEHRQSPSHRWLL